MDERTWSRHANPASAWSRVLTNPLVYVPIWNRSWRQAVPVSLWFALNPRLFPPPEDDSAWATRSVLGEQRYTAEGLFHADLPGALNGASAASFSVAAWAAYRRRLPVLVAAGALALGLKLAFLGRMVDLYDGDRTSVPSPTPAS